MNDQRTSYGPKDKRSLVQWISIKQHHLSCEKNWTSRPSTSGFYGKLAGRLADKLQMDFEIFKILYRLNYLEFYLVDISAMLLIMLEVHFSLLFTNKAYFRVCFVVLLILLPFLCRSLLLDTSVPNDKKGGGLAFHTPYAYCFHKRMGHLVCVHLYE